MALAPGTRVGADHVIARLGEDGMGEVYRAHDPRLGRDRNDAHVARMLDGYRKAIALRAQTS
jgi:hypothetical protein